MESKLKEKALKAENKLMCQKFDKTTYYNKNGGKNVLRKKQTTKVGYKKHTKTHNNYTLWTIKVTKAKNKMMDKDIHNLVNTKKKARIENSFWKSIMLKDKIRNKHKILITFMFQVRVLKYIKQKNSRNTGRNKQDSIDLTLWQIK